MRSKKGFSLSYKELMWIPRLLFTVIVIGLNFFIIAAFIATKTDVGSLESALLANLPLYSPDGFPPTDLATSRIFPGVIEPGSFSQTGIQSLFSQDHPFVVGRFARNSTIIQYERFHPDAQLIYTDTDRYQRWQPLAQVQAKGQGSKKPYGDVRYVLSTDGSGIILQTVFIEST